KKAEEMYARAVEVDPKFAPGYVALGHVYNLEKRPEDAVKEYDAALAVHPRQGPAILAKVSTLARQNRVDEAIVFVQGRLQSDPKSAPLISLLGTLYQVKKDPTKAATEFRRALQLDDKFTPARFNLARRSEEHTSELQSRFDLVCRLLLEKKT